LLVSYGTAAGSPGKVTFLAGRIPVAGERVTVSYRNQQRSVARLADTASIASEAVNGAPGTCRWLGKRDSPGGAQQRGLRERDAGGAGLCDESNGCRCGKYAMVNPEDIWPGDVLAITSAG
jgi:hypothetical protein